MNALPKPTKAHFVYIVWEFDESDTLETANVSLYEYDTQAQLEAFLEGVEEAYGFSSYKAYNSDTELAVAFQKTEETPADTRLPQVLPEGPWYDHVKACGEEMTIWLSNTVPDNPPMTPIVFQCGASSMWSHTKKNLPVPILRLTVHPHMFSDEPDAFIQSGGELCVWFDDKAWDCSNLGLIYTDAAFEEELAALMQKLGITGSWGYSEAGMQGSDFVSLDCDAETIKSFAECCLHKEVAVFCNTIVVADKPVTPDSCPKATPACQNQ